MKKSTLLCAVIAVLFFGCEKADDPAPSANADTTAPVLVLNGNAKDTVSLNATYSDAGATANDNVDGNITANVVVSGNLNMNQTGDYQRSYNVQDAAGNSATPVTRMIHVRNDAYFLAGNYAVAPNCGLTQPGNYNNSITVSSTINRLFSFSNVQPNFTGVTATGSLNAGNTSMTLTPLSGNGASFGGSGTITAPGKITLSTVVGQPGAVGVYFCTSTLVKQ